VIRLRGAQFREDAGPLAHPVRPEEYVEINNFYTATVYEKGAEVIRMLRSLVGAETNRKALDLYFERHDGQACTIEDWLAVFEDASGRDLSQFKRWYGQAGTPRVTVAEDWDGARYALTLSQTTPPTPGQPVKRPLLIPVAYGLLGPDGRALSEGVLELSEPEQTFAFDVPARPVASLLRGFSAPVILERTISPEDRAFLLGHDTDPFNKWEAGRAYALLILGRLAADPTADVDVAWLDAMLAVADDPSLDPAFKALALGLPSDEEIISDIAASGGTPDPIAVHRARRALEGALAAALGSRATRLHAANVVPGPYSPDAAAAGRRALRARALAFLTAADPEAKAAKAQFDGAADMTERMAALALLVVHGQAADALARFHADWGHDRLVIDKWFAVQASLTPPDAAVATVSALGRHPDFDWRNPNRFRSLIGAFASANPAGFHAADGSGYRLVVDWLLELDAVNPQTTARLAATLGTWRMFDEGRQALMRSELERLAARPGLSRDTGEIVGRLLGREAGD
jgi:aminopeptidase N